MNKPTVIKKEVYTSLLEQQKETYENKVKAAQDDLDALNHAIEDLANHEFNEVEVTEINGAYTFAIIDLNTQSDK
ncbi:hypothetical protein ACU5EH_06925 [Aliivibrio salmonicida]|uniref:hypothetical protein n=1 Tax=Aliivibrio salmonicida TaxID=40269 RepID=UPI00406C6C66